MRHQLNGVIVLDKPADISSAKAVSEVKKLLNATKAGHAGTLDPFATGVLVCCLNQATRLADFFLHGPKTYEAVLHLGIETDTQDATGSIVQQSRVPKLSGADLEALFERHIGHQMQLPPVYAALKHQGTPLYKLARKGTPVQKPARPITIEGLRLMEFDLPEVVFEVTCSAGTYVRTLCADLGRAVGCGGHLARLHRSASSGFSIDEAVSLARLQSLAGEARIEHLVPMAAALRKMPVFRAGPDIRRRVAHGQPLTLEHVPPSAYFTPDGAPETDKVKVVDAEDNLMAVLQRAGDDGGYLYCCVFN